MRMRKPPEDYFRSVIFGIEDSLVSTTGVIAGVSIGSQNPHVTILAAIVTIAVEALSMAAGQFLSERAVHELQQGHTDRPSVSAGLMFLSYGAAGCIPVVPLFFADPPLSVIISIASACIGLFILGYVKGRIVRKSPFRSGTEMLVIGGAATLVGAIAGRLVRLL